MASDSRLSGPRDDQTPDPQPDSADAGGSPDAASGQPAKKSDRKRKEKRSREPERQSQDPEHAQLPVEKAASAASSPQQEKDRSGNRKLAAAAATTANGNGALAANISQPTPNGAPGTSGNGPQSDDAGGDNILANRFLLLNAVPSWVVSMLVHAALLMTLALMTMPARLPEQRIVAVANPNSMEEIENLLDEEIDALDIEKFEGQAPAEIVETRTTTAELDIPSLDDVSAAPEEIRLEGFGDMVLSTDALMDRVGGGVGSGLGEVRGVKARRAMIEQYGGSEGSEAAVAAALEWLAEHQMRDGGWHFDHTSGTCKGRCSHPGVMAPARNGATAMALLPFLGAGQTHKEGKYQQTVEAGLKYLIRQMKLGNSMGDLSDAGGRLYSHGLASIVLCEAYAMTNDSGLLQPAQLSLNFIVYAQDPIGGGWRYRPRQSGDTSVLGWQLMACKSGHMAYLKVPRKTFLNASKFLDFVQEDNGAMYGYTVPARLGRGTTAVGLLCRMYLGWKHDESALREGIEYLHKEGPRDNMYYNYYATQVMRHYGGEYWDVWNSKMRDRLVNSQDKKGHAKGSWHFPAATYADRGGRLYCTSMAAMILEVYYRHMPIYGKQASEEEFPL